MAQVEKRKKQRFEMMFPVTIVAKEDRSVLGAGETRNMSSSGILFAFHRSLGAGQALELTIDYDREQNVDLRCLGYVVRCEPASQLEQPLFLVAAQILNASFVRKGSKAQEESQGGIPAAAATEPDGEASETAADLD